jgi:hypothetical protein
LHVQFARLVQYDHLHPSLKLTSRCRSDPDQGRVLSELHEGDCILLCAVSVLGRTRLSRSGSAGPVLNS